MDIDYSALLQESQNVKAHLKMQIGEILEMQNTVDDMQDVWNNYYYDFLVAEPDTEPPGGGRWNDAKRLGYVKALYPDEWRQLEIAKRALRSYEVQLELTKQDLAHLYRVIRVYEIYAKATDTDSNS